MQVFGVAVADVEAAPELFLMPQLHQPRDSLRPRILGFRGQVLVETEIWGSDVNPANFNTHVEPSRRPSTGSLQNLSSTSAGCSSRSQSNRTMTKANCFGRTDMGHTYEYWRRWGSGLRTLTPSSSSQIPVEWAGVYTVAGCR